MPRETSRPRGSTSTTVCFALIVSVGGMGIEFKSCDDVSCGAASCFRLPNEVISGFELFAGPGPAKSRATTAIIRLQSLTSTQCRGHSTSEACHIMERMRPHLSVAVCRRHTAMNSCPSKAEKNFLRASL